MLTFYPLAFLSVIVPVTKCIATMAPKYGATMICTAANIAGTIMITGIMTGITGITTGITGITTVAIGEGTGTGIGTGAVVTTGDIITNKK